MNWIKYSYDHIKKLALTDEKESYIIRYKNEYQEIKYFIGQFYIDEADETTCIEKKQGGTRIIIDKSEERIWLSNECPFGSYCDEQEIDINADEVTHIMLFPKEPNELD